MFRYFTSVWKSPSALKVVKSTNEIGMAVSMLTNVGYNGTNDCTKVLSVQGYIFNYAIVNKKTFFFNRFKENNIFNDIHNIDVCAEHKISRP